MKRSRKKALLEGRLLKVRHSGPSVLPPLEFWLDVETIKLRLREMRRVQVKTSPVS